MGARGTIGLALLALFFALAASLPSAGTAYAQENRDRVLPGCGICYPGGYDINTVGDANGRILDLQAPADGPVRFVVAGERERWVVLASPAWFWKSAKLRLFPGDSVTVRGSKTLGADGTLYLVAREIHPPGNAPVVVLRSRRGTPLWGGISRGDTISGGEAGDCRGQGPGRARNGGVAQ